MLLSGTGGEFQRKAAQDAMNPDKTSRAGHLPQKSALSGQCALPSAIPSGLIPILGRGPNVETLGYRQSSLRDVQKHAFAKV
jgi:hypothetical protein